MIQNWNFETKAIHSGFDSDTATGATSVPIYQTASYEHDSAQELSDIFHGRKFGYQYSRIANPTVTAFESRINALENGLGTIGVASGMAAVTSAILSVAEANSEIISAKSLFGGTYYLFRHVFETYGVAVRYVPSTDVNAYEQAITNKTRAIFLETIGNPKLDVPNIKAIADVAKRYNIPLMADCTTVTSYLFDAKAHGVDVILLSTTKYLCGSGTTIGGAIVDTGNFNWKQSRSRKINELANVFGQMAFLARTRRQIVSNTGAILSPMNAFIAMLGFDTLALRMEKHCANALALAEFFTAHPKVKVAGYPGLKSNPDQAVAKEQFGGRYGALVTVRLGSKEAAFKFIDNVKIAKRLVNIGDTKTLVIHPASTIYRDFSPEEAAEAGVFPDLVRISVGLENIDDLKADFDQALGGIS